LRYLNGQDLRKLLLTAQKAASVEGEADDLP
jgi:hypothetical protein